MLGCCGKLLAHLTQDPRAPIQVAVGRRCLGSMRPSNSRIGLERSPIPLVEVLSYRDKRTWRDNQRCMSRESIMSVEARLIAWRELDRAATAAEADVKDMGQGVASPSARDLLLRARQLRADADREFGAILRSVKASQPSA